ncbi:MAG: hypothetical protein D1H97_19985, partial [Paracoccus sp. BP8]
DVAALRLDPIRQIGLFAFCTVGDELPCFGPEGDFSPSEIDAALDAGYVPITLGSSRLRTETAALMACMEVAVGNRRALR